MKNFILIKMSILLLLFSNLKSQTPDVDPEILYTLLAYDNGNIPGSKLLEFGLDQSATDSLDIHLGELELPPPPPVGVFFTRFLLPPGNFGQIASFRDIRKSTGYPFSGSNEFRLRYQVSEGATLIIFKWDLPNNITGLIQDLFGGVLINKPMSGKDSLVISNFVIDQLKMVINYNAIVPVELVSFSAKVVNQKVELYWRTSSELNNYGFEIQKRTSFSKYETIGFVNGKGTTSEIQDYRFYDNEKLMFRTYYYRLKQINFDGSFSYSQEIQVELFSTMDFILNQNYPNPFNPSTTISFTLPTSSNVSLKIYNNNGEKVDELANQFLDAGFHSFNWDAYGFTSGVYFYEITTDNYLSVKKMLLIK